MFKLLLKDKRGFTLVEVLVVLTIIGIIGLVAVPSFEPMQQSMGLRTSARELASELRYAQQKAVAEGVAHSVYVDVANNLFSLRKETTVLEEKRLAGDIVVDPVYSTGITGNFIVTTFTETGNPVVGAGNKTIALKNNSGRMVNVVISTIGRVSIRE